MKKTGYETARSCLVEGGTSLREKKTWAQP